MLLIGLLLFTFLVNPISTEISDLEALQLQCKDGTFGYRCLFTCRCYRDRVCDKETGRCPRDECANGFWGQGCQLDNNCFYNGRARSYMGTKSVTDSLFTCQRWDSQVPHRHSYNGNDFPDRRLPDKFCRTTKDAARPWCYTSDKDKRWEHCNINNCNCPTWRFGPNCEKECHCADISEACDSILGICSSGCAQGWEGYNCQTPTACPTNKYGWDCTKTCYCKNPLHCNRYTGPTDKCECKEGYFHQGDGFCQAVTPPEILYFNNDKVNPGQPAIFNCTVTAYPTPGKDEIRLEGISSDRKVERLQSKELNPYLYTRFNVWKVDSVKEEETVTCAVSGKAGTKTRTIKANVYKLPVLSQPPKIAKEGPGVREVVITWLPWSKANGDVGEPPIMWYSIWLQKLGTGREEKVGIVTHFNCGKECNFTIDELEPNTEYAVRVSTRRDGEGGEGPPGPPRRFRTLCGAPSEPPLIESVTSTFEYNSSFPETQLIVMWRDPPMQTWNCNNISTYLIHLNSKSTDYGQRNAILVSGDTPGNFKNIKSAVIPDLIPATTYCVTMSFANGQEMHSPKSEEKCLVTLQTTPAAPRNLKLVRRSSASITVTWEAPLRSSKGIKAYMIILWKGFWKEMAQNTKIEVRPISSKMEYTIEDLESNTQYNIQVMAVNSAGEGDPTPTLSVTTSEGVPSEVTSFKNESRTDNSISLVWKEPTLSNGKIKSYLVSCGYGNSKLQEKIVPSTANRVTINGLRSGTVYNCSISAATNQGYGPTKSVSVWTKSIDPIQPPAPVILERTPTTMTISLQPLNEENISFYRIIVEETSSASSYRISKRGVADGIRDVRLDFKRAKERDIRAYIAAQLPRDHSYQLFIVGDNNTYEGYYNAPLEPRREYSIWYGAYTILDGMEKKSFSLALSEEARRVTTAPENNHVPVIVAVIVVFILLILVFALFLFLWRKRHIASEREKAEMPNFGPTIIPEPDTSTPSTPVELAQWYRNDIEIEPLIEPSSGTDGDSEPVYGNVGLCTIVPVKVEDLWDYVKANKINEAEGLKREYRLIPAGLTASCEIAKKTENKDKNRYGNIIAYDHSRVILKPVNGDIHDDYTNANFIEGYKKPKAYIAAQGPTKSTMNDIWRMVWEEKSKTVIMLTNPTETGKKKCEQYWPDAGETKEYAGIKVKQVSIESLPDFSIRTFHIQKDGENRTIKQFHYTTWPDHGVPRFGHSLLLMRQKIRAYDPLNNGPPIVHCSAGVGRTGTYIAVDVNLEEAKHEGIIDVHNFVQLMRTQRVNMVQTLEQYIFVYDVLLEALICGDTTISTSTYPEALSEMLEYDQSIGKSKLEEQYEVLNLISSTMEKEDTSAALKPENIFKNRDKNVVPANRCRPYLVTPVEDYNNYINAVFLNSYRRKDSFIVTQMPLPNTAVDFWRMIYDQNSYCIVMLNEIEESDEMCQQYWTLETCGEKFGPFIVETTAEIKSDPSISVRDFTITNTLNPQEVPRVVRQFHFHRWPEGSPVPNTKASLLDLLENVETWQKQFKNTPVTVHCMNGVDQSGLFVAASCIVERIKTDREVDVFQSVKQMRLNRSQLICNMEQYRFCHELALEYVQSTSAS
ncbi:receptor-type tyrosine-protein phosphatase kappa-like isoform X1 [Saccostrea cucullata]|uniref:receptor-type tyrosine-protein phosphatase kappa-like isoform X1 n=1 Tax=Saccostrea cuccullata TaxID=36930 RepID=UPI002ED28E91